MKKTVVLASIITCIAIVVFAYGKSFRVSDVPAEYKKTIGTAIERSGNEKNVLSTLKMANDEELPFICDMISKMSSYDLCNLNSKDLINHVKITLKTNNEMPWKLNPDSDLFKNYVLSNRISCEVINFKRDKVKETVLSAIGNAKTPSEAVSKIVAYFYNVPADNEFRLGSAVPHDYSSLDTWIYGRTSCRAQTDFTVDAIRSIGIPAVRFETATMMDYQNTHTGIYYYDIKDKKWYLIESNDLKQKSDDYFNIWHFQHGSATLYINPSYPKEDYFSTKNMEELTNIGNHKYPEGKIVLTIIGNENKKVNIGIYRFVNEINNWYLASRTSTDTDGKTILTLGATDSKYGKYKPYLITFGTGNKFVYRYINLKENENLSLSIDLEEIPKESSITK